MSECFLNSYIFNIQIQLSEYRTYYYDNTHAQNIAYMYSFMNTNRVLIEFDVAIPRDLMTDNDDF